MSGYCPNCGNTLCVCGEPVADVALALDADHAVLVARAIGHMIDHEDMALEDAAVLRGVADVIDRQLAPETLP
jgi:hypothetical protein